MNKDQIVVLAKEVDNLLKEVNSTHRYSMSRIYKVYNEIYSRNETPQSCASCLIRKMRELKRWREDLVIEELKTEKDTNNLSKLKAKYNELPTEDRESDIGVNMLSEIQGLTDESKQSQNVGNYDNQPKRKRKED